MSPDFDGWRRRRPVPHILAPAERRRRAGHDLPTIATAPAPDGRAFPATFIGVKGAGLSSTAFASSGWLAMIDARPPIRLGMT
eukprot:5375970-Pyramimonas_sp.AAC.1